MRRRRLNRIYLALPALNANLYGLIKNKKMRIHAVVHEACSWTFK
jgi:hypothetical protein